MPVTTVFSNEDLSHAILAVPEGHRHLRLAITTKDGDAIVLQEAAVAAVVRAYTTIKTHPAKRAVKMVSLQLPERKKDYAENQLIEADAADEDVAREITEILGGR